MGTPQSHTLVSSTQGQLLFSPQNPSVAHKFASSTNLSVPHVSSTHSSVPHVSSTPVRQFHTNSSDRHKSVRQISQANVWNRRICVELTALCRTDVWNRRICVELTALCRTDVWNRRICVELTA